MERKFNMRLIKVINVILFLFVSFVLVPDSQAVNSEYTRITLKDIPGVYVVIEDFNQNILKYEKYLTKVDLTQAQLQKAIEEKLKNAGIKVLTKEEWMNTLGRPGLCITINTHENEKYWLAYDVRVELRQGISLQRNSKVMNWSSTWSSNITGIANMGNLQLIKSDALVMVEKFIQAYKLVNR